MKTTIFGVATGILMITLQYLEIHPMVITGVIAIGIAGLGFFSSDRKK